MARKIIPITAPSRDGDPSSSSSNGNHSPRTVDNQGEDDNESPERQTQLSPQSSEWGLLGAVPRSPRDFPSPNATAQRINAAIRNRRRLNSLNLEVPQTPDESRMFFPDDEYPPRESVIEGQELYLHFLHEQMRVEGLNNYESSLQDYHDFFQRSIRGVQTDDDGDEQDGHRRLRQRHTSMNLESFETPIWRQTGRELKALAEEFARSHERQIVRLRAEAVDVSTLSMEKFFSLLRELFQGGNVTRERILVLFFFCSDIAIQAVRSRMDSFLITLTQWTLQFIKEQVCDWVQRNGGWHAVLRSGLDTIHKVAVIGMCVFVIVSCCIYIRKNL